MGRSAVPIEPPATESSAVSRDPDGSLLCRTLTLPSDMDANSQAPPTQHNSAAPARAAAGPAPIKGFAHSGNGNPEHLHGSSNNFPGSSSNGVHGRSSNGDSPVVVNGTAHTG